MVLGPVTVKDWITVIGVLATFGVAMANLIHSIRSTRKTAFVNTVTASRLRWIDSLRDKVSEFIAVTVALLDPDGVAPRRDAASLLRERDTLKHQIILHLNPNDPEDQRIRELVDRVSGPTSRGGDSDQLRLLLEELRIATQIYLKKEWTRVKKESVAGPLMP